MSVLQAPVQMVIVLTLQAPTIVNATLVSRAPPPNNPALVSERTAKPLNIKESNGE